MKETKTTIPISRTPKPISEFGLKPGKYRPSAVKVAGFALMLIALGVMMPMLRTRMAATKRTGKHMPITGGKHAK